MRRSTYAICALILVAFDVCWFMADNPPPPPAPPAEALYQPPPHTTVRYICSISNEEAAMYFAADGSVRGPIPTGRDCDYLRRTHKWLP